MEATPSFNFTPQGIGRKITLKKNCIKEANGYRLKSDISFGTPTAAAACVLGRIANGREKWVDEHGYSLRIVTEREKIEKLQSILAGLLEHHLK